MGKEHVNGMEGKLKPSSILWLPPVAPPLQYWLLVLRPNNSGPEW